MLINSKHSTLNDVVKFQNSSLPKNFLAGHDQNLQFDQLLFVSPPILFKIIPYFMDIQTKDGTIDASNFVEIDVCIFLSLSTFSAKRKI